MLHAHDMTFFFIVRYQGIKKINISNAHKCNLKCNFHPSVTTLDVVNYFKHYAPLGYKLTVSLVCNNFTFMTILIVLYRGNLSSDSFESNQLTKYDVLKTRKI